MRAKAPSGELGGNYLRRAIKCGTFPYAERRAFSSFINNSARWNEALFSSCLRAARRCRVLQQLAKLVIVGEPRCRLRQDDRGFDPKPRGAVLSGHGVRDEG